MKIEGKAPTPKASRYLQQVCKHWGHRFTATFDEERGTVDFGDGSSVEMIAQPSELELTIQCEPDSADILKKIVEEHINRFAFKEGALSFQWKDVSAT